MIPLLSGRSTPKEYFATFKQDEMRKNVIRALFFIVMMVLVVSLWTGPVYFVLQNVVIALLLWWVEKLEQEITRRNKIPK